MPRFVATRSERADRCAPATKLPHRELMFDNGIGGFTRDGREYVITTGRRQVTPAPWANVLANPNFGTVVSRKRRGVHVGRERARIPPDAVAQRSGHAIASGEAFYMRDEETGRFWSPTPLPCARRNAVLTRHGFGYSVFEHTEDGIAIGVVDVRRASMRR